MVLPQERRDLGLQATGRPLRCKCAELNAEEREALRHMLIGWHLTVTYSEAENAYVAVMEEALDERMAYISEDNPDAPVIPVDPASMAPAEAALRAARLRSNADKAASN